MRKMKLADLAVKESGRVGNDEGKFFRDALWIVVGAVALGVANHMADLGIPTEFQPLTSAVALYVWRKARVHLK